MKTSTRFTVIDDIHVLTDENTVSFDHQIIAYLIAFYRHELDLKSILNRCKNFKCFQMIDLPIFDFLIRPNGSKKP